MLLALAGYRYGERSIDRRADVAEIRAALPTLEHVVHVPYFGGATTRCRTRSRWDALLAESGAARVRLAGVRPPAVRALLLGHDRPAEGDRPQPRRLTVEHLKNHGLSWDLGPGDRLMWFSTTAWMMWNALISALLLRCAIVMIDGNPAYPDLGFQWRLAEQTETTMMGLSPAFLMGCRKAGLAPGSEFDLSRVRADRRRRLAAARRGL